MCIRDRAESIDSEKWLFDYKLQEYKDSIPNLIFNDRRKKTAGLCGELRKRIAMEMDGGEEQFFVDSKPIAVSYTHLDVYKRQVPLLYDKRMY